MKPSLAPFFHSPIKSSMFPPPLKVSFFFASALWNAFLVCKTILPFFAPLTTSPKILNDSWKIIITQYSRPAKTKNQPFWLGLAKSTWLPLPLDLPLFLKNRQRSLMKRGEEDRELPQSLMAKAKLFSLKAPTTLLLASLWSDALGVTAV